jgi:hypothetical protein
VAWSAVVAFDADQLDQQWKPPEQPGPNYAPRNIFFKIFYINFILFHNISMF